MDAMTARERWLAALEMKPTDRLPFWPKLDGAYPRAQAAPFDRMDVRALHAWIGSDRWEGIGDGLREVRRRTSAETLRKGDEQRTVYRTPHGSLELVLRFDAPSSSWHPTAFPVRTAADLAILAEWWEDVSYEPDAEAEARAAADRRCFGEDAVVSANVGTTPLMHFVQFEAGLEGAQYLLADAPGEVAALFAAALRALERRAAILFDRSPADLFYLVENTSTTLVSPAQFRRYSMPQIEAIGRLAALAGRRLGLHMCGLLKGILPDLAELPAVAYEAFTSPTLGDTTLLDGRTHCPDVCLIGGTNAVLWTRSAGEICAGIEASLDELPHHRGIVVTSAGVMPPRCRPETIRDVCARVRRHPVRP